MKTAWVFHTLGTNWCRSAAGISINFSTQCDSGQLCVVCAGSQQGDVNDLLGIWSLVCRKAHILGAHIHSGVNKLNSKAKQKAVGGASFFLF